MKGAGPKKRLGPSWRVSVAVSALLVVACHQATPSSDPELASATRFVQAFYAWYIPSAQNGSGWLGAIRDSGALFSPPLVNALRADADAQAHAKPSDGIVGLDWDPFLAAQDYCDGTDAYKIGNARRQGESILVDVRGKCWQRKDTLPDVIAEVRRSASSWTFVTFRSPSDTADLLDHLEYLRRARDAAGEVLIGNFHVMLPWGAHVAPRPNGHPNFGGTIIDLAQLEGVEIAVHPEGGSTLRQYVDSIVKARNRLLDPHWRLNAPTDTSISGTKAFVSRPTCGDCAATEVYFDAAGDHVIVVWSADLSGGKPSVEQEREAWQFVASLARHTRRSE